MGATNPGWKRFERKLARDVGTERLPVTGRPGDCDFDDGVFRYQAKFRRRGLPKEVWDWLDGVRGAAKSTHKTGILVVHRSGRPHTEAAVVLSWADWCDWHGAKQYEEYSTDESGAL